jgi:hypothetical protein
VPVVVVVAMRKNPKKDRGQGRIPPQWKTTVTATATAMLLVVSKGNGCNVAIVRNGENWILGSMSNH